MLEERPHCVTAAEPEEQWKQMKTICRKPQLRCLACLSGNTKTGLTKQIRKYKSCSKRSAPATIICLHNLINKPPRLRAVHSRLSLGPCRMIGGQDLQRGHKVCWHVWHAHLLRGTEGRLWTLTSGPRPSTLFLWKYPADKQGSHPPALVRAFRRHLQWPTHCAGVFTGQESPSGCEAGAGWPIHSWRDQESHNAAEGRRVTWHWWHSVCLSLSHTHKITKAFFPLI